MGEMEQMTDAPFEWLLKNDARQVGFRFARYGFVAKMFSGYAEVLEIGSGNKVAGEVVRQSVGHLKQVDLPDFDITKDSLPGHDGVFMLDVFEHIEKKHEHNVLDNLRSCGRTCVIGTPSLESQVYASAGSKKDHVNCVTSDYLENICKTHWNHVFMFGMNDFVLHTGFSNLRHYLLALCVS